MNMNNETKPFHGKITPEELEDQIQKHADIMRHIVKSLTSDKYEVWEIIDKTPHAHYCRTNLRFEINLVPTDISSFSHQATPQPQV